MAKLNQFLPDLQFAEALKKNIYDDQPILIIGPNRPANLQILEAILEDRSRRALRLMVCLGSDIFSRPADFPRPSAPNWEGLEIREVPETQQVAGVFSGFTRRDPYSISSTYVDAEVVKIMAHMVGTAMLLGGHFILDAPDCAKGLATMTQWLQAVDPQLTQLLSSWLFVLEVQMTSRGPQIHQAGYLRCSAQANLEFEEWLRTTEAGYVEVGSLKRFTYR